MTEPQKRFKWIILHGQRVRVELRPPGNASAKESWKDESAESWKAAIAESFGDVEHISSETGHFRPYDPKDDPADQPPDWMRDSDNLKYPEQEEEDE